MLNKMALAESGIVPDWLIRIGIRQLLAKRLEHSVESSVAEFATQLRAGPLAVDTRSANEQHYEVPAGFFQSALGPRMKYSSCFYPNSSTTLAEAEEEMLKMTCERAQLIDGQEILELGCGWGSLTLWMAETYRNSSITAISNSVSQRRFIEAKAESLGLTNVTVITADMREWVSERKYDRIVSVEMFEHMRNYALLFSRVASWLKTDGKLFVHIFCHKTTPYLFETEGQDNWMGRNFFTGGIMPSADLFSHFGEYLTIEQQWEVSGMHYWRTCEDWLRKADQNRPEILRALGERLPLAEAKKGFQKWRMFFMACAELFRYREGKEWYVAHYLMGHTPKAT